MVTYNPIMVLSALIIFALLLTLYLVVPPLSKHRPMIITDKWLQLVVAFYGVLATYLGYRWVGLGLVGLIIVIRSWRIWLIIGIRRYDILGALDRAIKATRSESIRTNRGYTINDDSKLLLLGSGRTYITIWKIRRGDKKVMLTKEIFRKYLGNFFL